MKLDRKYAADQQRYRTMQNHELRDSFVVASLMAEGELVLTLSDIDRGIVGSAVPLAEPLEFSSFAELGGGAFTARREVGVVNIGGEGTVTIGNEAFPMERLDSLYIGRGEHTVRFASDDPANPARYYLVSYPAHTAYPHKLVKQEQANRIDLGGQATSNERTIFQSLRPGIVESCQLVMGFTCLAEGSVWNTFPPHTHDRRSEFYFYFDLAEDARVFHFMGRPDEMKALPLSNEEAALSPSWSMHCGVGSGAYSFIWSMGGENQEFDDMDHLAQAELA
ncbi:5-dehydro-4-deoxy-D-glucuronate isomerase [Altererythrobacter ishigakiensis]|uniref:5-dehydro-4-deoxy-D-glucuronate isomerase n=1 Tax=Altererythrobacter ishigakiensis TaxID=476157 RepID=A0A562UM14_9SPHN|nr:5-dehydro-4-deoxy-D-glucuronate isomerase [Altererythrobacter ishigakiensis]TWJ06671.1 4-deoxy-L-threo-5-hexosulose-uronate ketol-isomerase [Altererythrobacter ishigakiensis]